MGEKSRSEERFWRFTAGASQAAELPPPPYVVSDVYMSFVGARFREDAVRQLLPSELSPTDGCAGVIVVYSVGYGWGIAPFSSCYFAFEVQGHDAPDGAPAYYIATGYYSGRGFEMMAGSYNANASLGQSRHYREGDLAVGVAGPPGVDAVTTRTRPDNTRPPPSAGVRHYMGRNPRGGTNLFAIAFSGEVRVAEPVSVEIADAADERMRLARPLELLWAAECPDGLSLTFGPPRLVGGASVDLASDAAKVSLLDVFTRIGRAAVLVGSGGEIIVMNRDAAALMDDGIGVQSGRLRASRPADQTQLDRIIAAAIGGDRRLDLEPIGVQRQSAAPVIAQAMPIDAAVIGRPAALILLNDPASERLSNPGPALQLLGLTPAEARIASLIGAGHSPQEAAERLELSLNTVRSSLKLIFDKLAIGRQSELARIVTRLDTQGSDAEAG